MSIDWTKQHNGVHRASDEDLKKYMPDVYQLVFESFPENMEDFTWDVKVHMLMPSQWPCIPNWHYDNVPRVNNVQDWGLVRLDLPMYLWLSGLPLTEFRKDGVISTIEPETWKRFTQADEHRGTRSESFQWRGFIRATHKDILPANPSGDNVLRRHSQVYLDVGNFAW
tara:strand:+ start:86047 stop:86550 length:504 start_codon:yes stop_codon:yes gene_type:complete